MNFFLACVTWVFIGTVLGVAIWLFAVKGVVWVLALAALALVVAIGKIGCATH